MYQVPFATAVIAVTNWTCAPTNYIPATSTDSFVVLAMFYSKRVYILLPIRCLEFIHAALVLRFKGDNVSFQGSTCETGKLWQKLDIKKLWWWVTLPAMMNHVTRKTSISVNMSNKGDILVVTFVLQLSMVLIFVYLFIHILQISVITIALWSWLNNLQSQVPVDSYFLLSKEIYEHCKHCKIVQQTTT